MKNKLSIWERYANDESYGDTSVFKYRANRNDSLAKRRVIESVKYLNEAELDYKTQNTILKLLKIEEESGNYVYHYDGRYIWSIRRQIFNEHLENKEIQKNYLVMEGNL